MSIFGRHRVRGNFYHLVSMIFLTTMILWGLDVISDKVSTIIGMILFTVDYLAEMYDPHPDSPGPWFKSHFHRFFDSEKVEAHEDEMEDLYKKVTLEKEHCFKHIKKRLK